MEAVYRLSAGAGLMGGKNGAPFGNTNNQSRWNPPAGVIRRGVRLNADMVGRLRRAYAAGVDSVVLLDRFNISRTSLSRILNRHTWKNVP